MEQLKKLKFCRVKRGEKRPFENDWTNRPYSYEEIQKYSSQENYGVLCGYEGLLIVDADTPELTEGVLKNLPETFRVQTGSGGIHHYYLCHELKKKIVLTKDGKHYGEIQSWGSQCVGPGSIHPNGNQYIALNNSEIASLSKEQIVEFVKKYTNHIDFSSEKQQIKEEWMEKFIQDVIPKWKKGDRQELALSTAGYLRKEKRLGENSVKEIISEICNRTNDTEKDMRLRAVIETFKKDERDIKGIRGLNEKGLETREIFFMSKFSPVPFADGVMRKNKIIYDKNKVLWKYEKDKGLWIGNCDQSIRQYLRNYLIGDEQQKRNYIDEIISYLKDVNYKEDFDLVQNPFVISFRNKVFDLKKGEFREFKEDDYLTNKLDIDIDENIKECPKIDKFFEDCVGEEYKDILYDLTAYTLLSGMIPYQKLFFIYGPAGTGKSVYMNLIEKFLGKENYCSVEPSHLIKDQHATTQMLYKKANIVSDIKYDDLEDITQIKKLTGEDSIRVREMYKNPYNTKLYLKQIFSTNKLPAVKEKTKAWYRRLYIIEFANIIPQNKRDLFLLSKISTEEELKGLAYKCLVHLKNMYNNNFVFTYDIDEDKVPELYEELSNPVLMFIKENCVETRESFCFKWEFEERLNNWLKANHFPPQTKSQINQYMKEKYNESNRPYFDKTYRVWTGLRWKMANEDPSLNHINHFNAKIKKLYKKVGSFKTVLNSLIPLDGQKEDILDTSETFQKNIIKKMKDEETKNNCEQCSKPTENEINGIFICEDCAKDVAQEFK